MYHSLRAAGARRWSRWAGLLIAGIAGAAVAAMTGLALAKTPTTVATAHNSAVGETIIVNSSGRTLYELKPETTNHLLCKTASCFKIWRPVKVSSGKVKLAEASGIKGRLGILHRDGFFQVTLAGDPLYTFAFDTANGQAGGQGIHSFGGTWHVVPATATVSPTPTPTTPTTPTPTTTTPTTMMPCLLGICY
jgi:predicted lipoprotein with Yx(FWY)xxD motif